MVTLRDVARAADVSPATASRALHAPELVSPARRARVEEAARDLGYHPNRAARELVTGRTHNLGLIVPDLTNPFFAAVAKGVQARARGFGFAVFVADAEEDGGLEAELVSHLIGQVDGIILSSPRMRAEALERAAREVPVVLLNREHDDLPAVSIDNADGVRQALRHLVALGHRRVGYVGGPPSSWSDAQRRRGLAEAEGVEVVDLGHVAPDFTGGVAAGDLLVAAGLTAVLAFNDLVAIGLISRLRTRGVRVPQDVSVVGFDDTPSAAIGPPPLTTVAIPLARLGHAAVDLLRHPDEASGELVRVELVVRESTGPAPTP